MPAIRYAAGILKWTKEEMEAANIKTKKLLTMHGNFHPKSNTQKFYTSRKEGGMSLKATNLHSEPFGTISRWQ